MTVDVSTLRAEVASLDYLVKTGRLPEGFKGYTDTLLRIIWLDEGLGPRSRRSTLAHELVHAKLGHAHDRLDEAWLDDAVDVLAAGALFTEADFIKAVGAQNGPTFESVAQALGVDRQMLRTWHRARKLSKTAETVTAP